MNRPAHGGYPDADRFFDDRNWRPVEVNGRKTTGGLEEYTGEVFEEAAFKNFHRALCERFGYPHDDRDWRRDQVSLIEHIVKHQPSQYAARMERAATGWRQERDYLRAACDKHLEELLTRDQHQGGDTWFWQGDGSDHLESMGNHMAVVIRADALRQLLAKE